MEKKEISPEFLKMPSYAERYPLGQASHEQGQSYINRGVPKGIHFDMTDNFYAITVGDKLDGQGLRPDARQRAETQSVCASLRVVVEDCPGHWSWASPFTVQLIDGEMVQLEMVNELVEMKRLSLS